MANCASSSRGKATASTSCWVMSGPPLGTPGSGLPGSAYSMGSARGRGPRGKAASIRDSSASVSRRSPAPALSAACSGLDALGIANSEGRRSKNRSATWRGVARCAAAISSQDATAFGVRAREIPVAERAVGDHRDAVGLAPGDHRMLDGSLPEVVEDLVAREAALPGDLAGLLQVGHVEIAHAPGKDLPGLPERLEGREGLLQRVRTPPVQEIGIQPVGAEAGERPLAGRDRAGPRGVLGEDLRDQEDLVASPGDRLAHDLLGVAVHLRGVDVGQAQVEAPTQGVDRVGAIAAVDIPGPLADRRDLATGGAEVALFHDISSSFRPRSSGNLNSPKRRSRPAISDLGWATSDEIR